MKVHDVVVLREVAADLNEGKAFYDRSEPGVGDYFWDSLCADIESLTIYAGIHAHASQSRMDQGTAGRQKLTFLWAVSNSVRFRVARMEKGLFDA